MKISKCIWLLLLLVTFTNACAPEPVYRLESLADKSYWYQGVEYVQSHQNDVTVSAAYYRHMGPHAVLDIEIANYSDDTLWVDPANFQFSAFESGTPAGEYLGSGYAVNPEEQLLHIDKQMSRERADERTAVFWDAADITVSLAESLIDHTESEAEQIRESQEREDRIEKRAARKWEYQNDMNTLFSRRASWEIDALRKTDLFPGEYIRGLVFFPLIHDAKAIQIDIDTGSSFHTFLYRQHKYKP